MTSTQKLYLLFEINQSYVGISILKLKDINRNDSSLLWKTKYLEYLDSVITRT